MFTDLTITANQLTPGDAIYGRNGHGYTTTTVTLVTTDGDTIIADTRLGDYRYNTTDTLDIVRETP